ncbi:hypothetical protein [Kitasatospora sp. NPDC094015]|uniref:hypothetical protein n=1 Tax=Kitasatospora sp. NPDC094015 TaxID=3155205 RepID=UPI003333159B
MSARTGRAAVTGVAAVAVAVVLLLAGAGLLLAAHHERSTADTANRALTDRAATGRVIAEVGDALDRLFSYSATEGAGDRAAAAGLLTGPAAEQYRSLTEQLRGWVGDQQLTLTTRVADAGVVRLTADRAELLVLLDQSAERAGGPPTVTAAQLAVTARLEAGRWLIDDLKSL